MSSSPNSTKKIIITAILTKLLKDRFGMRFPAFIARFSPHAMSTATRTDKGIYFERYLISVLLTKIQLLMTEDMVTGTEAHGCFNDDMILFY